MLACSAYAAAVGLSVAERQREAEECYGRGEWGAAMRGFREAAESCDLETDDGKEMFAMLSNNAAASALCAGEVAIAEAESDRALSVDPSDRAALYRRGLARASLKRNEDARRDFQAVLLEKEKDQWTKAAQEALKEVESPSEEPVVKKASFNKGFLERARAAKARRQQKRPQGKTKVVDLTPPPPVGTESQHHADVKPPPTSVFTVFGAGVRPEMSLPRSPETEDMNIHVPAAAALLAAVQLARDMKDDKEAIAFAKTFVLRTRDAFRSWGLSFDRLDGSSIGGVVASQLRARFLAVCNVAGRRCLELSKKCDDNIALIDEALAVFLTEERTFSTMTTHRGHAALARDAYVMRAKITMRRSPTSKKDDHDSIIMTGVSSSFKLDALRSLALDQWHEEAVKLVARGWRDDDHLTAFGAVFVGRSSTTTKSDEPVRRPGSTFRKTEGVNRYFPRRPGQKMRGLSKAASLSYFDRKVATFTSMQGLWARWAAIPPDWSAPATAGDLAGAGPIHLFVFRNDGRWSGGKHVCVPRTVGASPIAAAFAKSLKIQRHSGNSFTLYTRDGQPAPSIPALPNFAWIAVGDDYDEVWAAADGKVRTPSAIDRYQPPANYIDVFETWPITNPSIPRRHASYLVSGRLDLQKANNDTILQHLSRGHAVAIQAAHFLKKLHFIDNAKNDPSARSFRSLDDDTYRAFITFSNFFLSPHRHHPPRRRRRP